MYHITPNNNNNNNCYYYLLLLKISTIILVPIIAILSFLAIYLYKSMCMCKFKCPKLHCSPKLGSS